MAARIIFSELLIRLFGFTFNPMSPKLNFLICLFLLGKKISFLIILCQCKKIAFANSYQKLEETLRNKSRKRFTLDSSVKRGKKRPKWSFDTFVKKKEQIKKLKRWFNLYPFWLCRLLKMEFFHSLWVNVKCTINTGGHWTAKHFSFSASRKHALKCVVFWQHLRKKKLALPITT